METKKILSKKNVMPQMLYPTEAIASIDHKRVKQCYEAYCLGNGQIYDVLVVHYNGYLYIYEGHEQVIAAAQFNLTELEVIEIDRKKIGFWADDEAFVGTLHDIGITAVYDFEAVSGFRYKNYPLYYSDHDVWGEDK